MLNIILGIASLLGYFFKWIGLIELESSLWSFSLGVSDYFNSHQIMYSVCDFGSLVATIIFCRKELRGSPSSLLKFIRSPSANSEMLEKIKRFCILVVPYAAIYFLLSVTHKSLRDLLPNHGLWLWIPSLINVFVVPIILIMCDRRKTACKTEFDPKDDRTIGLLQLLGFVPGVGRFSAFFGTMRCLGYDCHQAFRYYILISIPLLFENLLLTTPGLAYPLPLFFWEELDIPMCLIAFVCIAVIEFLFLKFCDWFWKKVSLTAWSIFWIIFGFFNISHFAIVKLGEHFFLFGNEFFAIL